MSPLLSKASHMSPLLSKAFHMSPLLSKAFHMSPLLRKASHMRTLLTKPTRLSIFFSTQKNGFTLESPFLSRFTLKSALLGTLWRALGPSEPTYPQQNKQKQRNTHPPQDKMKDNMTEIFLSWSQSNLPSTGQDEGQYAHPTPCPPAATVLSALVCKHFKHFTSIFDILS